MYKNLSNEELLKKISELEKEIYNYRSFEEKFREVREYNKMILDFSPVAYILHDADLRIISVNKTYKKMIGIDPANVIGRRVDEFLLDNPERDNILKRLKKARDEGIRVGPTDFKPPIADDKYFSELIIPIFDSKRLVVNILTVLEDITIRKETEKKLLLREEQLRIITDGLPVLVAYVDKNQIYRYVNREYEEWFGIPREEVIGKSVRELLGEKGYSKVKKGIEQALSGKSVSYDGKMEFKNGKTRSFFSRNIPHFDSNGNLTGFLVFVEDITERKQAEEEKERLESQLQHAIKMEAVGLLAGGIAHDFNNTLQIISGFTQILKLNENLDEADLEKVHEIEMSIQKASKMIKNLLLFSRKEDIEPVSLNINERIKNVCKLLESVIPKNIKIEMKLENNLEKIYADPNQIEQILMNLGTNSRDALIHGGILRFETKNYHLNNDRQFDSFKLTAGDYVLLKVYDNGIGMDNEIKKHIFDPFFTTKEVDKGTGLGLSIVYGIIKNHRGFIRVESKPGRGTTFYIYFPVTSVESKLLLKDTDKQYFGNKLEGKESVLLVDDEKSILKIGRDILQRYGYSVAVAENGTRAIEIAKKNKNMDIAILDLDMHGISGRECMEEMLKINSNIKIIISSGYIEKDDKAELIKSGAADFLDKPYDLIDMVKKIRYVMER